VPIRGPHRLPRIFFVLPFLLLACDRSRTLSEKDQDLQDSTTLKSQDSSRSKVFTFSNYKFQVAKASAEKNASLGLFFNGEEVYYEESADGYYDTIMPATFNNDSVPDFIVSFTFDSGATLYAMVSQSLTKFKMHNLVGHWNDLYCDNEEDTLVHLVPIKIIDLNKDGTDEVILNSIKMNGEIFSIECTDTVYFREK
jgi:hypothetical protein